MVCVNCLMGVGGIGGSEASSGNGVAMVESEEVAKASSSWRSSKVILMKL